ncbi:MAG: hypothetical protein U0Q18_16625 [Bryobacteraceae bacterium]
MGSIPSSFSALSYLTAPGGLLSNLPSAVSPSALSSASPQDLVTISAAALEAQIAESLFGSPQAGSTAAISLPVSSTGQGTVLPGVSSADLTNASAQEQTAINVEALVLQQVQSLFGQPASTTGSLSLLG